MSASANNTRGVNGTVNTQPPATTSENPPVTPEPKGSARPMGEWSPVYDWPQVAIHLNLLPDGKVMSWSSQSDDHQSNDSASVYVVDVPADSPPGQATFLPNPNTKLFCSGQTFLADGRLLVTGGQVDASGGSADTNIFDFRTYTWQKAPQMSGPRWYATSVTLANGEALTLGGLMSFSAPDNNLLPQVWKLEGGWRDLTGAIDDVGEYPRMHLAPNGKVFKSGITQQSRYLDTSGAGSWSDVATLNFPYWRDYGSSVIYDTGKVIVMGGGDPPTDTAEIIDLNDAQPAWKWTSPMKFPRRQHNATILADGNVLVTGGMSGPGFNDASSAVFTAEMWNPQTGAWTTMADMKIPRIYHSTAILLPDGRVLSAGGGEPAAVNGTDNLNAEIFSPPYLFNGPRPAVTSAPASVGYGQSFTVGTPDAADIVKATWIRLSSVTHSFNSNQRISHLSVAKTEGGVSIVAPNDPNLSPPGHYMLFLINSKGVPSIAKIVQIL